MKSKFLALIIFLFSWHAAEAGNVVTSWHAPAAREDGQLLPASEIGGYRLAYDCGIPMSIIIEDGTATEYVFTDLPEGLCTFSISAFDTAGAFGGSSDPVTIMLGNGPASPNFGITQDSGIPNLIQACIADSNCRVAISGEWQRQIPP